MSERKIAIKILYVEDDPALFVPWFKFICETWGEGCRGSRSREKAIELIEEQGFLPDLVIFDRGILFYEDDEVDSKKAGDSLYYYLHKRGVPIAVFSGDDLGSVEPYSSHKPLKLFPKPFDRSHLFEAVDLYLADLAKENRDKIR